MRQGHECRLIALHDRNLACGEISETALPGGIPVLRFPAALPWPEAARKVEEYHSRFAPDWISLQFVPYGFHDKGIVWKAIPYLERMTAGARLQIMFHELWLGEAVNAPLKHRLVGAVQRLCILRMLRLLKPDPVATSNPIYQAILEKNGIRAMLLPLFGNIPVVEPASQFPAELAQAGVPADPGERSGFWICLLFGVLLPGWKPEPLLGILRRASELAGKRVCIVSVGRLGGAGEGIWAEMSRGDASDFRFIKLGQQPVATVSHLMQTADFAVAGSPLQLIGKSSSVASLLDHGLPVIVNMDDWRARMQPKSRPPQDPLVHPLDGQLEANLAKGLKKRKPCPALPRVAAEFLRSLSASPFRVYDSLPLEA